MVRVSGTLSKGRGASRGDGGGDRLEGRMGLDAGATRSLATNFGRWLRLRQRVLWRVTKFGGPERDIWSDPNGFPACCYVVRCWCGCYRYVDVDAFNGYLYHMSKRSALCMCVHLAWIGLRCADIWKNIKNMKCYNSKMLRRNWDKAADKNIAMICFNSVDLLHHKRNQVKILTHLMLPWEGRF